MMERMTDEQLVVEYGDPTDPSYGLQGYAPSLRFGFEVEAYIEAEPEQTRADAGAHFDRRIPGLPSHRTFEKVPRQFRRYTVADAPEDLLREYRGDVLRAAAARKARGAVPDSSYTAAIRAIDTALAAS
jgi:hypothetical protein